MKNIVKTCYKIPVNLESDDFFIDRGSSDDSDGDDGLNKGRINENVSQ